MDTRVNLFLTQLIENTNKRQCTWDKTGVDQYRLLLRNGSVVLKKEKALPMSSLIEPPVIYRLRLFDQNDCFYSLEVTSITATEYDSINALFLAIKEEEQRIINEKIDILSKDLCL